MNALLDEKKRMNGLLENPNELIVNLTDHTLEKEELEVLKLGLNYSVALRPKEPHILAEVESLWEQICNKGLIKKDYLKSRIKTSLQSFAFSYLDIDDSHFSKDSKKKKIINNLREKFSILKPDKGNGIVLS